EGTRLFNQLVDDVRLEHGRVLADSMDVAVLAGQPVEFEPFAFSMLEREGRWNSQPLVHDICTGGIKLLVLSYPIQDDSSSPVGLEDFPMWPPSVMAALRDSMRLEKFETGHWFYTPVPRNAALSACEAAAQVARGQGKNGS